MSLLDDPALLVLPHPVRVDAALGEPIEAGLLSALGLWEAVQPYLGDERTTTEWILNRVPGMTEAALASLGAPGGFNLGAFLLLLARARLRAHGDPILEVSAPLQALLAETDLAAGLPARFFCCPYPMVYIALARPCPLTISNRASGLHEVEGAYVGSFLVPPGHPLHGRAARSAALGLDPRRPTRVIELTITGSPIGKHKALDDASQDLVLFIQDEDACLGTMLARHNAYYASPAACDTPGFASRPEEVAMSTAVIELLAKVLLYLNLPEAERAPRPERTELERRLRQLGPKKAARLTRRLPSAYDRILIGPTQVPLPEAVPAATGTEPYRSLRPHWRRGHFRRIRFGEQLSESRLGWIRPVLVNADALIEAAFRRTERHAAWRALDPRSPEQMRALAADLGIANGRDGASMQGILRLFYGFESFGAERFDLYSLQREIRGVDTRLRETMGREPSLWELVSATVRAAADGDEATPRLAAQLRAYQGLEDATLEESLGAETRLADQVYRRSARLCADGCQGCLHTGSDLMPEALAEPATSRRMLERLVTSSVSSTVS